LAHPATLESIMLNVMCIPDLQIPAEHVDALDFIQHVMKVFFADVTPTIVNMGDEVDQHTLGKWTANPNGLSAKAEMDEAKLRLQAWYAAFPKTFVCISNHTYRVFKRAREAGIPDSFMRTIGEAYEAPATWKWRDRWIAEGVCFEHGEMVSGQLAAIRAATMNRMSTVIGHQHSNGGVLYSASEQDLIYGLNTGCLIDIKHYAFEYGKTIRNKPTLGCGVIRNGIPYFVPMLVDHNGRWLRRI
jgi:hypothetical protein